MEYTKFQKHVINKLKSGKSLLLIAPTGLGKTLAVTGDIQDSFCKMVYAVPLRSLGKGIQKEISTLKRDDKRISAVIHHGDIQESKLFGEEVVITTYDQVVCAVPGLPLSLPLRAGHAIAGALLMSRLILDETHLAWSISDKALSILLAIIDFRQKLGLQTIVLTATLPKEVATLISKRLKLELIIVGEGEVESDEGLILRENNRKVTISTLDLKNKGKGNDKKLDWQPLDDKLKNAKGKRIYFANTVERLQTTYDRLIASSTIKKADEIIVLHNRMPRSWRADAEQRSYDCFGKGSPDGDRILLTNQVAEAGLDISAPLVISDPAPVDTLVQRAGRCARWFRNSETKGEFVVITAPKTEIEEGKKGLALPYKAALVLDALQKKPNGQMTWQAEKEWVNQVWGGGSEKAMKSVEESLNEITFALNLFDRAAQEQKPGQIAGAFREILSVEVAVEEGDSVRIDDLAQRDLQIMLMQGQHPETSSISLGRAWALIRKSQGKCAVIRYNEHEDLVISPTDSVRLGDVLIVPSSVAYLHRTKGLCFGDTNEIKGVFRCSDWLAKKERSGEPIKKEYGKQQTLLEHTSGVMKGVYQRFTNDGMYRSTLKNILKSLEPEKNTETLANIVASLSMLAAGFHDLGKADKNWQAKAEEIEGKHFSELIGRTSKIEGRIGVPHTPPGYNAIVKAAELLIGNLDSAEYLIRSIALSAARHHSSFLNPSQVTHHFDPHPQTNEFIKAVLKAVSASETTIKQSDEILEAAKKSPAKEDVPLLLPNVDLFPVYAIVGRAILMADREDAAGVELEMWRTKQ
ncbi:MAG: CRISPR-associated helicase Cas3' [Deltaproteobacteria bacterium]|nr:CRISPR-associated helicase Cas3' [Deltaproteobacteria bacterium]MCL5792203.1 CRISPR-associated helicase Cas3' [Deltaproteobacteria bacterium]